jgi:hypothetical protein
MIALRATNHDQDHDDDTPLARTLAELALHVMREIVVESRVVALLHETTHMSEAGLVHEVTVRTGLHLRGPTKLLRLRWPPIPAARPDPPLRPA